MKLNLVPARQGLVWFQQGVRTFFRQPVALTGLFFMFMAAISVCSLLPVVGNVLALALMPAATLGMMAASAEVTQGRFPMPTILAVAFQAGATRARAMVQLGLASAAGFALVLALTLPIDDGQFAHLYLFGGKLGSEQLGNDRFLTASMVFSLAYLPVSLLFWHAPALVHWHGVPPLKSLFFSWMACWRNKWAFVVFSLAWSGAMMGGLIAASLVGMALGPLLGGLGSALASGLVVGTMLALMAMFFVSLIFTFRDCFQSDAPSPEALPG